MKYFLIVLLLFFNFLSASNTQPLKIVKIYDRSRANSIALCLQTNRYFRDIEVSKIKPFIKVSPQGDYKITAYYDELCISSLKPQSTYTIDVNKNIPLNGVGLDKSYTFSKKTGNYEPNFTFKEGGYILPAKGDIVIPVESININRLQISLFRVNRNNLINILNSTNLKERLSNWDLNDIEDSSGYHLWDKKLTINSQLNSKKVTAIPVGSALKKYKPGVYILAAYQFNSDGTLDTYSVKTQWFMVSDIGLYTQKGIKKLHIYTKHLSSAKAYSNVKIEVVSKNNEVLATTTTKDGYGVVDSKLLNGKKGMSPKAIYAYGENGDFSVLNLTSPPLDLTDRGDGGLEPIRDYDAFVFTNRGIFKPKESVEFYTLVKDARGNSSKEVKLSAKLIDSRGEEVKSMLLTTNNLGYASGKFKLPNSTGRYKINIYSSSKEPIGALGFSVEDFIPPKIEAKVLSKPQIIKPEQEAKVKIAVSFLTGDILIEPKATYSTIMHTPKTPFKEYKEYHFGKIDEGKTSEYLEESEVVGDSNGTIEIVTQKYTKRASVTRPLAVYIKTKIQDPGGRAITKVIDVPFANKDGYIGIKPKFEDDAIDLNQKPAFDLIYLSQAKPKAKRVSYKLIEEEAIWNWRSGGKYGWEYYRVYSDAGVVKKGVIEVGASPTKLELDRLSWGYYRLEVTNSSGSVSSYRFSSGYDESASKVSPDKLPLLLDKKVYKDGDKIKVQITPKFSGPLIVSVATNEILETKELKGVAFKPVEVIFKAKKAWGSGAYILATSFRAQSKKLGASRAVGLGYFSIRDPKSTIKVDLNLPKRVKSKSKLEVKVDVKSSDKEIFVALFAVDKGILNLTNFKTPNPLKHFFGKHKLGVSIKDIYSELIKAYGEHAQFDVGAGDEAPPSLNEESTANKRVLVTLAKVVKLKDGKAKVEFNIPDYQGSLKVMAIAWSKNALGSSDGEVVVKDDVSTELYMPKFLSKGDEAKTLVMANFDKSVANGEYRVKLSSNAVLDIEPREFTLSVGSKRVFKQKVNFKAKDIGEATINLNVLKGDKVVASREFKISIRDANIKSFTKRVGILEPNAILDAKSAIDTNKWSSIKNITLKVQASPMLGVDAIKDELKAYCCRCGEQTTSRGFAFLKDKVNKDIVESSIERLYELQKYDGGFGLWSNSEASLWVSSYVLDFLSEAKSAGFVVSQDRLDSGLNYLQKSLNRWSKKSEVAEANAYALYVLAKNKKPLLSEVMYHVNSTNSPIKSAAAWAELGATLDILGEKEKAKEIFELAKSHLNSNYYGNYGGALRDKTLLVTLLCRANLKAMAQPLFVDLSLDAKDRKYLSTQEMSSLIRASEAIDIASSKLNIEVNGKKYEGTLYSAKFNSVNELPNIKNLGASGIWYSISFVASPNNAQLNSFENRGFSITKEYFSTSGKKIDLANVRAGDEVIVVISGKVEDSSIVNPLVLDLLPAGLEIENPHITGYDTTTALPWLKNISDSENQEYRDDRYIAALKPHTQGVFIVAYATRAVTKGKFNLPVAFINDMYKPRYRAFAKALDKIEIKDAKDIVTKPEDNNNSSDSNTSEALSSNDYTRLFSSPVGSLKKYTTLQLNYLRNGIFAQVGLNFKNSNPNLDRIFSKFSWYKPTIQSGALAYAKLTPLQKSNVAALLKEEKRRLGGLSLADFYRVHTKELDENFLKRYNKKQLRVLRNSLIARYGYEFKDRELLEIFKNLPWYKPDSNITTSQVIDELMNQVDRKNLDTILKVEKGAK